MLSLNVLFFIFKKESFFSFVNISEKGDFFLSLENDHTSPHFVHEQADRDHPPSRPPTCPGRPCSSLHQSIPAVSCSHRINDCLRAGRYNGPVIKYWGGGGGGGRATMFVSILIYMIFPIVCIHIKYESVNLLIMTQYT